MKVIRRAAKPVSVFLTVLMVLLSVPYQSALATMVGTETVLDVAQTQEAREYLNEVLSRRDVQTALMAQGVDPLEAQVRVATLSDAEVVRLARQVEHLPAGGNAIGVIVGAAVLVFIVLLITDILGYTDVFPFVN
ncbi:MAG: PA2779 family protein [Deltaproteobacteria bacterium]|nr:PA2779 family protein [Deltaproteobacteria bacterium]